MRELADSRCIAGLLAIAVAPFAIASVLYRDEIKAGFRGAGLDAGITSRLITYDEAALALPILVIALVLGTLRAVGPDNAGDGTVRAIQASIAVAIIGSWIALHAALGPVSDALGSLQ